MEKPEAFKLLEMARTSYKKAGTIFKRMKAESGVDKHIQTIPMERSSFRFGDNRVILLLVYLAALVSAELVTTIWSMELGFAIYTCILLALLFHSSLVKEQNFSHLLLSLMALPIIGMIGLSIPIMNVKLIFWFPIIAVPIFAASYAIMKVQGLGLKHVGLQWGNLKLQVLIALSGVLLGALEYLILRPVPLISHFSLEWMLIGGLILIISTGLAEELLFRGIIQKNVENVFGSVFGLLYTSFMFATMHIVWNSIPDLVFVFSVSMFYGYVFQKTRSILGITLSHGILNTFLFLIAPFLLS